MSPVKMHDDPIAVGDYWVNRRTGVMIEILEVALDGTTIVVDARCPVDKPEPRRFNPGKFDSALWMRLPRPPATA